MRRVALKRKTTLRSRKPLSRGKCRLKKSKLAFRSKKKVDWEKLYREKKLVTLLATNGRCADCRVSVDCLRLEPHHPAGRIGRRILAFVWICSPCHDRVHLNGKWALETGRLLPEFRGGKSTPETPNFYGVRLG